MATVWRELTSSRLFGYGVSLTLCRNATASNDVGPVPVTRRRYITAELTGRLGTEMFRYATLQGLARRTNHTPIVLCRTMAKHFPFIAANCIHSRGKLAAKFLENDICTVQLRENHSSIYETTLVASVQKARNKNVYITRGFLQSWKYFHNVSHIIRQHFQFDVNVISFATKYLRSLISRFELNATDVTPIGVHVRRRDFLSRASIKRGRSVATADYFHAAMNYFRKQYTNCVFLVATDDVKWCRKHLMAPDVIMIADSKVKVTSRLQVSDIQRDMGVLRLVEHNILSTGTFSWWIGWFTPGQVVYYKNYPANGSALQHGFTAADYYPQHWTGML